MQRNYLPAGPLCPNCSSRIVGARALTAWREMRKVYCASCGHTFRPTAGTPIHETSWQPEEFVQCLFLAGAGRSQVQISARLGKSTACVRDMLERIRLRHPTEPPQLLASGSSRQG